MAILLLFRKVGLNWEPDGPGMRYTDDTLNSARDKAASYGETWVSRDPSNRRYELFP